MFRRWVLPILAILLAGSTAAWWITARSVAPGDTGQGQAGTPAEPLPRGGAAQGQPDNPPGAPPERKPPLAILCGGELGGRLWLPPCSLSAQGGLDRVGATISDMVAGAPNSIVLDTGDATCAPGEAGCLELSTVLGGLGELGLGVFAVGEKDLAVGLEGWRRVRSKLPPDPRIICANVRDDSGLEVAAPLVRAVTGGRTILIVAVLSPSFEKGLREAGVPVRILPPAPAVRAALAAEGKADYVILLSHAPVEESRALVRDVPEADLVLTAHAGPLPWREPEIIDGRMLLAPGAGWLYVGGALLRDAGQGRRPELIECLQRAVTGRLPPAPTVAMRMDLAMKALRRPEAIEGVLRTAAGTEPRGNPTWTGPAACASCHPSIHAAWKEDVHARSMEGVRRKDHAGVMHCLSCHATAPGRRGGSVATGDAQNAVTCEACHGPGAAHAASEGKVRMGDARASCAACHVPDMSPGFKFEDDWPKVKHGK